ncbi:MAG: hypothetical protein ACLFVD_07770 [Dehalococcoidia bacterium]
MFPKPLSFVTRADPHFLCFGEEGCVIRPLYTYILGALYMEAKVSHEVDRLDKGALVSQEPMLRHP